jgi:hypothetical protein
VKIPSKETKKTEGFKYFKGTLARSVGVKNSTNQNPSGKIFGLFYYFFSSPRRKKNFQIHSREKSFLRDAKFCNFAQLRGPMLHGPALSAPCNGAHTQAPPTLTHHEMELMQ